jgi:serine/threonine-protein kinase
MAIEKLGRYEITSELGQGAMGTVYKAVDPLIERTVAIKTISLDLSKEELADFEERFYREAKSAGGLAHPNIVTIYDVGETDKIAYIAMEFLEGQSLREILDSGAVLPVERIAEIAAQVADGLAYAQEHGIVHRDIKPANIIMTRSGTVKITDFGIAHMPSASKTHVGMLLGSPKYMSPEQVVGKTVDGRSDIFSLGVVLYEMLAGSAPFGGDNISTLMYRILNETPVWPSTLNPLIPAAFDRIVARALAKSPEGRYQHARELADDLRELAAPAAETGDGAAPGKSAAPGTPPQRTPVVRKFLYFGIAALVASFAATVYLGGRTAKVGEPRQTTLIPSATTPTVAVDEQRAADGNNAVAPSDTPSVPQQKADPQPGMQAQPTAGAVAQGPVPDAVDGPAALLAFAVSPWGEVYIDGKRAGVSPPLKEIKVAAGQHRIEIRNLNFPPYSETLDLQPDSTRKIKYKFN